MKCKRGTEYKSFDGICIQFLCMVVKQLVDEVIKVFNLKWTWNTHRWHYSLKLISTEILFFKLKNVFPFHSLKFVMWIHDRHGIFMNSGFFMGHLIPIYFKVKRKDLETKKWNPCVSVLGDDVICAFFKFILGNKYSKFLC